jgi:hypothetical protein
MIEDWQKPAFHMAMKISNIRSGKTVSSSRRKTTDSVGGTAFASELRKTAEADTGNVTESSAVSGIDAILATQEVGDEAGDQQGRRLARQYADNILDRLEDLRRDVLLGAVAKDKLAGLAQTMRAQRKQTDDPRLNEIIDEIELRAEVEIAKLTRTP